MSFADSLEGSAYFLPALAAAVLAGVVIVRRRYAYLEPVPKLLAVSVLATVALMFAGVVPAALGILSRPTWLLAALLLLLAAWRVPDAGRVATPAAVETPPSSRVSIMIGGLAVGAAVVYELARARVYAAHLPDFIDALGFHLPGIATWIQTGSLWQVDQFLPGFATAQYPNSGDFVLLSVVLPWHDVSLTTLAMTPYFALTGAGTYALATELGAARAASATFAAASVTVPFIAQYAFDALPDLITLSMVAIGLLFVLRYSRTQLTGELAIGGLALGLAFGTKWYGVTAVAAVVAAMVASWLLGRRRVRHAARDLALTLAMIAAVGGIWLVRNTILSGDPLYPKAVSLFGIKLFAGSHHDVLDQYGYTIAHYFGQPHILRTFIYPGFKLALGFTGAVVVVGLVVLVVALVRDRRRLGSTSARELHRPFILIAATIGIFLVYIITPGTAYGPRNRPVEGYTTLRWLMPAIVLALAGCALAARRLGRVGIVLEIGGLVGVIDSIRRVGEVSLKLAVGVTLIVLVAVAAGVLLRRLARGWRPRPALLGAGGAIVVVGLALAAWLHQRQLDHVGYARYESVFAWIQDHAAAGHRIGITGWAAPNGLAVVLPMFGPRLGNRVSYVGDWSVHSMTLPATLTSFNHDLARGRYDLLEVGLLDPGHTDVWARELGYQEVISDGRVALYRARVSADSPGGAG